jgi:hypothetical protein
VGGRTIGPRQRARNEPETERQIVRPGAQVRAKTDPDQAYFWTEEWQVGEREASKQAEAGEGDVLMTERRFSERLTPNAPNGTASSLTAP